MLHIIYLIFVILIILYIYLTWNFSYWKNRGIIGPKPIPFFGNIPNALLLKCNLFYDIDEIYRKYKGRAAFCGIFSGRQPMIVALDARFIKNILIKDFKNFQINGLAAMVQKTVDPIIKMNPFMTDGLEWKQRRAHISPAFTTHKLKSAFPIIEETCARLIKYTKENCIGVDGVDTKKLATKFTCDVVSNCIFGGSLISDKLDNRNICDAVKLNFFGTTSVALHNTIYTAFTFLADIFKLRIITKNTKNYFLKRLIESIKLLRAETSNGNFEAFINDKNQPQQQQRFHFINYLLGLSDRHSFTETELIAYVITFFIDGVETSALAISSILYHVANNEPVQHRLREEIMNCIDRDDGSITFEKLNEMKYLDQIIDESLRLNTPTALLTKVCSENILVEDIINKHKTFLIEKDIPIFIPVQSIHYDPEYYPNPYVFDPDRFNEENGDVKKYKDLGVYLSFGDGPRVCVGMRFGRLQTKAAVVAIIKYFTISVNKRTQLPLVLEPKDFLSNIVGSIWLDYKSL